MPLHLVRPFLTLVRSADAVLAWLATYALHSTILILAVWLLAGSPLGQRFRLANASWLWMVALCGGLVTATLQTTGLLSPVAGTLRLADRVSTRAMIRVELAQALPPDVGPATASYRAVSRNSQLATRNSRALTTVHLSRIWPLGVALGWFAGAVLMLGGFLFVRWRFLRSLAGRRDAEFTIAGTALREVLNRAGIHRAIRLTVADGLTSPVAIGRDEICLPRRVLAEMDPIQQESMLAHELAHLERRDSLWLLVARVIEAVLFFQPLNRLARRRMQDAAEFASDAFALQVLGKPVVLARCLARVAEWTVASPRLFAPAMSGRRGSMLVQRVERLTSGRATQDRGPGRLAMAMTVLAVALIGLVVPRASIGAPAPRVSASTEQVAAFRMVRMTDELPGGVVIRGTSGDRVMVLRRSDFGQASAAR